MPNTIAVLLGLVLTFYILSFLGTVGIILGILSIIYLIFLATNTDRQLNEKPNKKFVRETYFELINAIREGSKDEDIIKKAKIGLNISFVYTKKIHSTLNYHLGNDWDDINMFSDIKQPFLDDINNELKIAIKSRLEYYNMIEEYNETKKTYQDKKEEESAKRLEALRKRLKY